MAGKDQRLADVYYYLGTTYVETERYEDGPGELTCYDKDGVTYSIP